MQKTEHPSFSPNVYIPILFIVSIFLLQCGSREPEIHRPNPDQLILSIGDQQITARDVLVAFQESRSFDSIAVETSVAIPKAIREIGKTLAFERHLASQAKELHLDQTETFKKNHEHIVKDELYQKVILEDVLKKIHLSEKEIRRFYDDNRESLYLDSNSNQIVVQGIYVNFGNQRNRDEAESLIQKAHQELEQGVPFETVARKYSDAEPHQRGKENTIQLGLFDPEISRRLESLHDGEYTEGFELKNRFYLFKRVRFIEPKSLPFDQVKDSIQLSRMQDLTNNGIYLLAQDLKKKHSVLSNPSWLDHPDAQDMQAILLTVPGVYELTLGEFLQLAHQQKKWAIQERKSYLDFLENKTVCLAEAISRGWDEKEVAQAVAFWDQHQLAQDFINAELDKQVVLTEEQIRAEFEKNRKAMISPARYDISRLFFSLQLSSTTPVYQVQLLLAKAKAQAEKAREAMKSGMSFDEVAIQFRQNEDMMVMVSDVKNVILNDLSPEDQNFIAPNPGPALQAGEISEPKEVYNLTRERYGYEIFYIRRITPSRLMEYEEARVAIGQSFAAWASKKIREQLEKTFEESPVQYHEEGIQSVTNYLSLLAKRLDLQTDIAWYE